MNILVTGVGAIIGQGILKSLQNTNYKIYGVDIYSHARGQGMCDEFVQGVLANSPDYLRFIQDLVQKKSIDLIIPGIEQDLYRLDQLKDQIPCKIVLNNELLISLSKDKWKTYQFFKQYPQVHIIDTYEFNDYKFLCEKLGVPFLMKPKSSYASKGLKIINNFRDFDYFANSEMIFQRIVGSMNDEYTIEVFGDGKGNALDIIALKRTLAQDGSTAVASLFQDEFLLNYCKMLCSIVKPIGPTNFQFRREEEKYFLLEINPRISSSCSIRTLMGYNSPVMCVDYFLNSRSLEACVKKQITVVRYIEDWIFEN